MSITHESLRWLNPERCCITFGRLRCRLALWLCHHKCHPALAGLTKVPIDGQPKSIVRELEDMARSYIKVCWRTPHMELAIMIHVLGADLGCNDAQLSALPMPEGGGCDSRATMLSSWRSHLQMQIWQHQTLCTWLGRLIPQESGPLVRLPHVTPCSDD